MKQEQQEVLALLREIDGICQRHKITYYLSPRLTFCGITTHALPQDPLCGLVLMKVSDMERFAGAFAQEKHKDRVLESMKENPHFPGFYLRYTDVNTLCFSMREGKNFQFPGMGIEIYPLRGQAPSRMAHLWNRVLEVGWKNTCSRYNQKPSFKGAACSLVVGILSLGGRRRLGNYLYGRLCRTQNATDTWEYAFYAEPKTLYYPADIFDHKDRMVLDGVAFSIPRQRERYLARSFGAGYKNREEEPYKVQPGVIVSARVGFEEYFQEVEDPRKLLKSYRRQYLMDSIGRRRLKYMKRWWKYAGLCAARRDLNLYYAGQKEYILNLYENRDFTRMEPVFSRYTAMMRRCLEEKEIYAPDGEIFEIYLEFLDRTGKTEFKEQIENRRRRQE